jgi:hypothetical protein
VKVIEINDGGFVWHVPLQVVAEARADHYADDPDTTREEEVAHVMGDPGEGLEWYLNNMDFEDVAEHAKLVRRPAEKTAPGRDAVSRIVDAWAGNARSELKIITHGARLSDAERERVEREILELLDDGLACAADLMFHSVLFTDALEGPGATVWGVAGDEDFHVERHDGGALITLAELEG